MGVLEDLQSGFAQGQQRQQAMPQSAPQQTAPATQDQGAVLKALQEGFQNPEKFATKEAAPQQAKTEDPLQASDTERYLLARGARGAISTLSVLGNPKGILAEPGIALAEWLTGKEASPETKEAIRRALGPNTQSVMSDLGIPDPEKQYKDVHEKNWWAPYVGRGLENAAGSAIAGPQGAAIGFLSGVTGEAAEKAAKTAGLGPVGQGLTGFVAEIASGVGLTKAASHSGDVLERAVGPFRQARQEAYAAETLSNAAGTTPEGLVQKIDASKGKLVPDSNPTLAQATESVPLSIAEQKLKQTPTIPSRTGENISTNLLEREADNNKARISFLLNQAPDAEPTQTLQTHVQDVFQQAKDRATQRLLELRANVTSGADDGQTSLQRAGQIIMEEYQKAHQEAADATKGAFGKLRELGQDVTLDASPLRTRLDEIEKEFIRPNLKGQLDPKAKELFDNIRGQKQFMDYEDLLAVRQDARWLAENQNADPKTRRVASEVFRAISDTMENSATKVQNKFGDLLDRPIPTSRAERVEMLNRFRELAGETPIKDPKKSNDKILEMLETMRTNARVEQGVLNDTTPGVQRALSEANTLRKEQGGLERGPGAKMVAPRSYGETQITPAQAPGEVFKSNGTKNAADVMKRFVDEVGDNPKIMGAVQDHIVDSLRAAAVKDGKIDPKALNAWLDKHSEALSNPAWAQLNTDLRDVSRATKVIQEAETKTLSRLLNGDNPKQVVADVLRKGNAQKEQQIQELARIAATDKTGASTNALRRAVAENLLESSTNAGTRTAANEPLLGTARFTEWLNANERALTTGKNPVFSKAQFENLRKIQQDVERTNLDQSVLKGSQTARLLDTNKSPTYAHIIQVAQGETPPLRGGLIGGLIGGASNLLVPNAARSPFWNLVGGALGGALISSVRNKNFGSMRDILYKAMLDPELAKTLALRVTERNAEKRLNEIKRLLSVGATATNNLVQ